ncbi:MAG: transporter permease [Frankiales bacterium]|nr:transporter permease [Frankiales bacterium]
MTTTTLATTREGALQARDVEQGIPLSRLTAVELRKMFNTRSGFWLMASIVIAALLATAAVIAFAPDEDLTYSTFGGAIGFPMAVILPMIAILSVTSEWSQRSGLTTFTLVPQRGRVLLAKALSSVAVGIASMVLALVIGVLGTVIGSAVTGTGPVWDGSPADCLYVVLGGVLGLLSGFMLGILLRSSAGALVAYFVYSLLLPSAFGALANGQEGFRHLQPWVDVNDAQSALFAFNGSVSGEQWAQIAVTGVVWLVLPLLVGLRCVMRSEMK